MSRFHLKNQNLRRILALTLVFIMVFSTMQASGFSTLVTAYAEDGTEVTKVLDPETGQEEEPGESEDPADPALGEGSGGDEDPAEDPAVVEGEGEGEGSGEDEVIPGDEVIPEDDESGEEGGGDAIVDGEGSIIQITGAEVGSLLEGAEPNGEGDEGDEGGEGSEPVSGGTEVYTDYSATAMFTPASNNPGVWSENGTDAECKVGYSFYFYITSKNGTGASHSKTFELTGENLETVEFQGYELGVPKTWDVTINTNNGPVTVTYTITVTQTATGFAVQLDTPANPQGYSMEHHFEVPLIFKAHSNGGKIEMDPDDVAYEADVQTVTESGVVMPTLSTSNLISHGESVFRQWLQDPAVDSLTFIADTRAESTSTTETNTDIVNLASATIEQTVRFYGFLLSEQPEVDRPDGTTIEWIMRDGKYAGYKVTMALNGGTISSDLPLPRQDDPFFQTSVTVQEDNMVKDEAWTSSGQYIKVSSTIVGTPLHSSETVSASSEALGTSATDMASGYANVTWVVDGTYNNPRTIPPRTNYTPGTTNVTTYQIHAECTTVNNTAVFVFQGEGHPSGTSRVFDTRRTYFLHEIEDLNIKLNGEPVLPGATAADRLEAAYNRGMVDRVATSDGGYRYYFKITPKYGNNSYSTQEYMPINTADSTRANPQIWKDQGVWEVDVQLKNTIKLDEMYQAYLDSGAPYEVKFFMSRCDEGSTQLPAMHAPIASEAGYIQTLYMDWRNNDAEFTLSKTGTEEEWSNGTSTVSYTVTLRNYSLTPEVGHFTDYWPTSLTLYQIKNNTGNGTTIGNGYTIILTYTNGSTASYDSYAQTWTRPTSDNLTVEKIEIYGFTVPAATTSGDTTTPGTVTFTLTAKAASNLPYTMGNSVQSGGPGGPGAPTGPTVWSRITVGDKISKKVYSNPECTDEITGEETVAADAHVWFKVRVRNNTKTNGGTGIELPFELRDRYQDGLTLVSATFTSGSYEEPIVFDIDGSDPDNPWDLSTWAYNPTGTTVYHPILFPEVKIPGGGEYGEWIMEYEINNPDAYTSFRNYAYARTRVGEDYFRTQEVYAMFTIETEKHADVRIDKSVSSYVYHPGCYTERTSGDYTAWTLSNEYVTESTTYHLGDLVLFQIGIWNEEGNDAPIDFIYDYIPEGLTYLGITANKIWSRVNYHQYCSFNATNSNKNPGRTVWNNLSPADFVTIAKGSKTELAYRKSFSYTDNYRTAHVWTTGIMGAGSEHEGARRFDLGRVPSSGVHYPDGTILKLKEGEGCWFFILCRVDSPPSTAQVDSDGRRYYENKVGVQTANWAIQDPEHPSQLWREDTVRIYYEEDYIPEDIQKSADMQQIGDSGASYEENTQLVHPFASIRYKVTITNTKFDEGEEFSNIHLYDDIPGYYTYHTASGETDTKQAGLLLDNGDVIPFEAGTVTFTYDSNTDPATGTNRLDVLIDKTHNVQILNQIYNKRSFQLVYWVDPVDAGKNREHTDTNVVGIYNGPYASWTTYAIGDFGVVLSKSQTIRGVTYRDIIPVPVHQNEPFLYTLTAVPHYDETYTIYDIVFEDELPNLSDGRDSEFSVMFADPDDETDLTVRIIDEDGVEHEIDQELYYTVTKTGKYSLRVEFNEAFEDEYSSMIATCQRFEVDVPVKAEELTAETAGDSSPFNADGDNKVARDRYWLSYKLKDASGRERANVRIQSNEVDVKTLGAPAVIEIQKALDLGNNAAPDNMNFTFNIARGAANTAGNDVQGNPVVTPLPSPTSVSINGAGTAAFNSVVFEYPGTYYYTITEANPGGQWTQSGGPITATVVVTDPNNDYNLVVEPVTYTNPDGEETNIITNTLIANTEATVIKVWDNGYHPASLTVELLANGQSMSPAVTRVLKESNNWTATVTDLPINDASGSPIAYTWSESLPAGYEMVSNGTEGTVTTIHNTYDASGSVTIGGTKRMTGRNLIEGEFTFELYDDLDGEPIDTTTNAANGNFSFDPINYGLSDLANSPFTYYVKEQIPTETNGVQYDTRVYVVTVTLTDNGNGTIAAAKSYAIQGGDATNGILFENPYTATASIPVSGTKTLTGRAMTDTDVFTFEMSGGKLAAPVTTTNAAPARTFSFDDIELDLSDVGKNYTYTVKELAGTIDGVTYSQTVYTISISNIHDNGDGTIGYTLSVTPDATTTTLNFINNYGADVVIPLSGTKTIDGRAMTNTDVFTFELSGGKLTTPATTTNNANGYYEFPDQIRLELSDAGKTYTYTVKELGGTIPGITYDDTVYTIVISNIADDGHGSLTYDLAITPTATTTTLNFTNPYEATASIPVGGTKTLTGRAMTDTDVFTFELSGGKLAAPVTTTNAAPARTFSFDDIELDLSDVGKNYTYTVKELAGTIAGVTYSQTVYTISITNIHDNGNGTIGYDLSVTPDATTTTLNFINNYGADVVIPLSGTKTIDGRAMTEDDVFTFELSGGKLTTPATTTNNASGFYEFPDQIRLDLNDVNKTYTYTLREVEGTIAGITYDDTVYTIVISNIHDNGDSTIGYDLAITPTATTTTLNFTNPYEASTNIPLSGTKAITGRAMTEDDVFTFELSGGKLAAPVTAQNAAPSGAYSFPADTITLDLSDVNKTYTYTLREVEGTIAGITYDDTVYTIVISNIHDNGDSTIGYDLAITPTATTTTLNFTNPYDASTDIPLSGNKILTGRAMTANDVFTFRLSGGKLTTPVTAQNAAPSGAYSFPEDAIHLDLTDVNKTYTYTVEEVEGNLGGVMYSTTVYTITISNIHDNGDSTIGYDLTITPTATTTTLNFTNDYEATGHINLSGVKTVTGRDLTANDVFTFRLYEGTDTTGTPLQTKTNAANGSITFDQINYTHNKNHSDLGEHVYTVVEVVGSLTGIVYDETVYTITVNVTDNGDGTLATAITGINADGSGINYNNPYVTTSIDGVKTWDDDFDRDGIRPVSITVNLLQDGSVFKTKTVTEEDDWSYSWSGLPKYHPGATTNNKTEYNYTVEEVDIVWDENVTDHGYTATYTGNDIKNTHAPELINIPVTKIWDDYNNRYNTRPETITVNLLADDVVIKTVVLSLPRPEELIPVEEVLRGVKADDNEPGEEPGETPAVELIYATAKLDEDGNWYYVFTDLYKYRDHGTPIVYTITEEPVQWYTTTIEGTQEDGFVITNKYRKTTPPPNPEGSITFKATKVLTGRDLAAGEFFFELYEGDKLLQTKTNAANGAVLFDTINYTKDDVGVHTYTISEVEGSDPDITYDLSVYTITVTVVDSGKVLTVTAEGADGIVFENTYEDDDNPPPPFSPYEEEPEVEEPELPHSPYTGDDRHTAYWLLLSFASLGGMLLLGRKRKEEQ